MFYHFICEPVTTVYLSPHFPQPVAIEALTRVEPVADGYTLRLVNTKAGADIKIRWGNHKRMDGAEGDATWEYVDKHQLANGIIRINYRNTRDFSFEDMVTITMHEVGHVFGLKHRPGNVVMNQWLRPPGIWRGSDLVQWKRHTGFCRD